MVFTSLRNHDSCGCVLLVCSNVFAVAMKGKFSFHPGIEEILPKAMTEMIPIDVAYFGHVMPHWQSLLSTFNHQTQNRQPNIFQTCHG